MSYSRWGCRGSGRWYTYWRVQDKETENRNTAIFEVCAVMSFTAKELRENMDLCMAKVKEFDPQGDVEELKTYALEFLEDVDGTYPPFKKDW